MGEKGRRFSISFGIGIPEIDQCQLERMKGAQEFPVKRPVPVPSQPMRLHPAPEQVETEIKFTRVIRIESKNPLTGQMHTLYRRRIFGEIVMYGRNRTIKGLIEKGFAYAAAGDVYFDVTRDEDYGKLTNRSVEQTQGEGGSTADRKRSAADFALWKQAKPGEPSWESPWGPGRPGWHIECSAMSEALLGDHFDIHGGGLDLVFPHHENEIAQSESLHGCPMASYWMHNGLMQAAGAAGKVGGRPRDGGDDAAAQAATKISKSTGAEPFKELLARHRPEAIRLLLLSTHYRSPIHFGEEPLAESARALEAFERLFARYERLTGTSFYGLPGRDRQAGTAAVAEINDSVAAEVSRLRALNKASA